MKQARFFLLALLIASPASAQTDHEQGSVAGVRTVYQFVRGFITAAAEQMPENLYSYQPTEEVRSFGEIIGHLANAGYLFCAPARGEQAPSVPNAEELTSKAEIVRALAASFEYCDAAYQIDTMTAGEAIQFFGQQHTKLSVLAFNMGHNYEHYGNLVTYLRLNGMVPPSSQGGM
ncbi:MAG TPA: DinB family protein [Longimicrobiales bacterium]|jgi:uncharacterized damage-inducible protein DinB